MELYNIDPSEIIFKGTLFASEFSAIFLVMVHDQTCVMKVVSKCFHKYQLVNMSFHVTNVNSIVEEVLDVTTSPKTVNWIFMFLKQLLTAD